MKSIKNFKELIGCNHDYYCHTNNYYSNDPFSEWGTWKEFYDNWIDVDVDMNLIFRWDIRAYEEIETKYYMEIFIIQQRKGIFCPQLINNVTPNDFDSIVELLSKHYCKIRNLWNPFI